MSEVAAPSRMNIRDFETVTGVVNEFYSLSSGHSPEYRTAITVAGLQTLREFREIVANEINNQQANGIL